ncbi:hypothetical protein [Arthrobacter wenxiniae]|jgi:hypothetical protein|uniref:Uncharacterized protein n=1 Tax=Arthrobacter wenxiniae TaxID=2713570 RepID=A0A7Y7IG09_9MICC|nr:hypothetical protein [Arthrobacter wenxiniae]NVM94829.1 hypothetical protein [Arthrobacter wenxiniae]
MDIDVRIDRLVLEGLDVDARSAALVSTALETELARRLGGAAGNTAEAGDGGARAADWMPANAAVPALRPAPVALPGGSDPRAMGRSIAGAVMGGLNHGR